jgi:hypothetical protein
MAKKTDCSSQFDSASESGEDGLENARDGMSAAEFALTLSHQRERLGQEYKHATEKASFHGRSLTYSNQQEAAHQIIEHYRAGKSAVCLVAQPGAGKTGVALEVMYRLAIGLPDDDPKASILADEMAIVSGMNDREWRQQFEKNMLPSLGKHVFHRGNLPRNRRHLAAAKLVVDDECHVAAQKDMMMSREFKKAGLLNIDAVEAAGRKILQISATPESIDHDLKRWRSRAARVVLQPSPKYKGFRVMLQENRIRNAATLQSLDSALELLTVWNDRYAASPTKKFFPIRVKNKRAMAFIEAASKQLGWAEPIRHDSSSRVEEIDKLMSSAPPNHTIIFVLEFWRASKRLVRDHVGGSYEAPVAKRNTTATSQGLTARFCDTYDYEGDHLNVDLRPLHYCDIKAIKEYLAWFEDAGGDFAKAAYSCPRLMSDGQGSVKSTKSKLHPTNITGDVGYTEPPVKRDVRKTIPVIINVTADHIGRISKAGPGAPRQEQVRSILQEISSDLYPRLVGYDCLKISVPRIASTIKHYITDVVEASETSRPYKVDIDREHAASNCFNCYVDATNNRLCFVIWNGAATDAIEHV